MSEFDTTPIDVFHHGALNPVTGNREAIKQCKPMSSRNRGEVVTVITPDGGSALAEVVGDGVTENNAYLLVETTFKTYLTHGPGTTEGSVDLENVYYVKATPFKRNSDGLLR